MPKSQLTDKQTILDRIKLGHRFIERGLAERDRIACKRFLDGAETSAYLLYDDDNFDGVGVLPESQEVGNVNYLAVNILTKAASIAIGDPDFHVEAGQNPDASEMVRTFLKSLWKARNWARLHRKALLKRSISGMGILACVWHDAKGPVVEHVKARDLFADPNVTDWLNLRWGGRRIRMPRDVAEKVWPKQKDLFAAPPGDIPNLDEPGPINKNVVELWCYWDETTEAVMLGSEELSKNENMYGRVPLYFLEGDIAPESEFSLGDYDTATGLQEMLARLSSEINEQAENSGPVGWYNGSLMSDGSKEGFADGKPSGWVEISGGDASDVFGYINGMPLAPQLLEAFKLAQQGLDSVTGVSEYQRGVLNQSVKFATEAALLANQSGARGNQARIEFEQFVDRVAKAVIELVVKFGPTLLQTDPMTGLPDPADMMLFDALTSVTDICVLESSTAYKDPATEMQSSLQLLQVMGPYIQAGVVNPLPLIMDVFRAFGKRDVGKYLNSQGMPMMAAPGQMPPGGNPAPGQEQAPGAIPQQGQPPAPLPSAVTHTLNGAGIAT